MFIVVSLAATLGQHGPRRGDVPAKLFQWHSFSPWHNLSKLSSAHGLPKELLLVVKVVQVVFYVSTSNHSIFRKNPIFLYLLVGDTENMAKVLRIIETEAIMRNIFFHLLVFAKHLLSKKIVAEP